MRKIIPVIGLSLLLTAACVAYIPFDEGDGGQAVVGGEIGVGYFYDYLSPFGNWVNLSPWGFVWCPGGAGFGWQPYSHGEWLWTDDGWLWDSFYEWGWAPFHYGRWGWDDGLGWFWVPGSTWGPAWVTWCWNDLYFGWAPLPPGALFQAGIGIGSVPYIPDRFWCFVDGRNFLGRDIDRWILPIERNRTILADALGRENIGWSGSHLLNGGVSLDRVQEATRASVPRYALENADRPGPVNVGQGTVRVFRSSVARDMNARPRDVLERADAAARISEMRSGMGAAHSGSPGEELQQRHSRELDLLEKSQERDRAVMEQRRQAEADRAPSAADRAKVIQKYQQRAQALQKQHQQERSQIQQRHAQEQRASQPRPKKGA